MKKAIVDVNLDAGTLVWNWADDTQSVFEPDLLSEDLFRQAAFHGLKQKLSDCYAGAATVREAKQAQEAVVAALMGGLWNAGRSSSGGIWVEALAKAAAVSLEQALEKWNSMDEDARKDLKKHPQVKQAKAEIELERAQAKAEGSELDLSEI